MTRHRDEAVAPTRSVVGPAVCAPARAMPPAMRPWLRRLSFTLSATIGVIVVLECLARLAIAVGMRALLPPDVAGWITTERVVFDPELGWRPASGFPTITGGTFKDGSFDRDNRDKTPGELRGYAFGDSQTHGAGLAETSAWPSVTERLLRKEGLDISVINLGSSGYRSAQVLRLLETYVLPNDPDFLIVDCMVRDSDPLPGNYGQSWGPTREFLFQSRVYRLLWLAVATGRGENTGPMGDVHIEQPKTPIGGAGNHDAIALLAAGAHVPLIFVDYPFTGNPVVSYAPAAQLPRGATVVPATAALLATGLPSSRLFLDANHLSVEGSEVVGRVVADTLRAKLGK